MKPTDKERREVAARLRDFESLREVFKESNICAFSNALGVGYMDWEHICARLADLIEPAPERTCRNEADAWNERDGFETYSFVCSECGYNELKKDADRVLCLRLFDLNYCRMCGARVEGAGE